MLQKIDCIMIKIEDPHGAVDFYERIFGLHEIWRDETAIGLGFDSEGDGTEIVLHKIEDIPNKIDVNYLVENVQAAVEHFKKNECKVLAGPFEIPIGECAVVEDRNGIVWSILDMSKGARK